MLAVVGPGRVGQALGRRLREGGVSLLGFLGHNPQHAEQAVRFAGGGQVLGDASQLAGADTIMIAVQDDALAATVVQLATQLSGFSGLCFHVSGAHGLEPLEPLAAAGSRGSLHPLCPLPDVETGYHALLGQPAVLQADGDAAMARLSDLAQKAGLVPVPVTAGDRLLYHTACVLAANGLTALSGQLEELFSTALGLGPKDARRLPAALMRKTLETCAEHGAAAALSGPVPRGDAELISAQLRRLENTDAELADLYRLLMSKAVAMADDRGALDADAVSRLRSALGRDRGG